MCNFRSYIATKTEILSLSMSNSHESIIEHYGLDDSGRLPKFVRIELRPKDSRLTHGELADAMNWDVQIDDQYHRLPRWFDLEDVTERARRTLVRDLKEPHHYYVATQQLPPPDSSDDCFEYVLRNVLRINQVVTPEMLPHDYFRLAATRRYPRALLNSRPPLTPEEEPCAMIREYWACQSSYKHSRPLTASEEPCYAVRRQIAHYGVFAPDSRALTAEEEPYTELRLEYLCRTRDRLKPPTHSDALMLGRGDVTCRELCLRFFEATWATLSDVEQELLYALLRSANPDVIPA